jgi:energy-coupling factor transport system permease/ATP-binding protein
MPIELSEITVQYPSSPHKSLHSLTTRIQSRAVTLLVGMTGSGKSTLLDVISGLVQPTSGSIMVNNRRMWSGSKPNKDLIMKFGSVFQYPEHQLFSKSVQGEFTYSLRPFGLKKQEIESRATDSLNYVQLPLSILPESPFILSGGQKRRVALATTYATKPDWLVLDEPTAGLDPDSVRQLLSFMQTFMEDEHDGGIVVATHDLDVFLPIADEVILLHNGHLSRHLHTDELFLHPEWLTDIGVALPPSVQIHTELRALGIPLPSRYLDPEEMAAKLSEAPTREADPCELQQAHVVPQASTELKQSRQSQQTLQKLQLEQMPQLGLQEHAGHPGQAHEAHGVHEELEAREAEYVKRGFSALDPRTKWLLCLFLSAAMLVQSSWIGLTLSVCITISLLIWSRVDFTTIMRYTKPVLFMLLISILLAAMQFGREFHFGPFHGFGFALKPAIITLKGFIGFLCVVEIGLLLPATTSSQEMNQGLSQLLSPLRKIKLPVEALALSASLLLRFIPMILSQLQRFARIAKSRGKRSTRAGRISFRDMPAVVIPLILAILKLGEDLSLAMEARGYRNTSQSRTVLQVLHMKRADYAVLTGAAVTTVLLTFVRFFG